MPSSAFTNLGANIRAGVQRQLLGGARINGSAQGMTMLSPKVAGGLFQQMPTSEDNLIHRCNVNVCEDGSVCGP